MDDEGAAYSKATAMSDGRCNRSQLINCCKVLLLPSLDRTDANTRKSEFRPTGGIVFELVSGYGNRGVGTDADADVLGMMVRPNGARRMLNLGWDPGMVSTCMGRYFRFPILGSKEFFSGSDGC